MQFPLLCIDKNYENLHDVEITADIIDQDICVMSLNMLDFPKRKEHVLELITNNFLYWEKLLEKANELFWLKNDGYGVAVFYPDQCCGYTRIYRYQCLRNIEIRRDKVWDIGSWKYIQSETSLFSILDSIEYVAIFNNWKSHNLKINRPLTELASGRISNTTVDRVNVVSKRNGCAVCGNSAGYYMATTLNAHDIANTVMLSILLCKTHYQEARESPCILQFFASLFYLNLDIPALMKLDYIPDNLIVPLAEIIASNLNATFSKPEKKKRGWHIWFKMEDDWEWLLRLNKLTDYAYILFDPSRKQAHRIDSANDHPDVPFGPDHQHFNPKTKGESIEPSFSYGIPILDFPLLKKIKNYYIGKQY
ncbi:Uncharacterised protein [Phocoenobacter uteri]|uniref:Uncharacterized protein n=1 Tax=Phocoenobacter uteri TaxID=146806 RepID=A0A379CAJ3_9PAST|nr:hypothetical protein [Phocoenobacter uteri]MDG6882552.1 hypothetical protein [Phocoenobacter uteri]SUB58716.1 Uncharacterised protein [Phocoenobacter uteri]